MRQTEATTSGSEILWAYYTCILALCLLCFFHIRVLLIDDGFIAHRYAANLVHGHGLVFNPGQRVEGITDLSWVLLMTVPQLMGWRPELFAMTLGVISGIAALLIAYRTAVLSLHVPRRLALIAVCAAACNADYWITEANGIESGLYSLVVVSAFTLILGKRRLWAGLLLGFATTLRPESMLLAPITLAVLMLVSKVRPALGLPGIGKHLWVHRALWLPWVSLVIGVTSWRFIYYGQLLPNTVIAKSHPLHARDLYFGSKYLFLFGLEAAPWVILPFAGFLADVDVTLVLGFSWIGYQVIVITMNGGDWMFGYRFMSVFFPVLVLLSARGLFLLLQRYEAHKYAKPLILVSLATATLLTQISNKSWTFDHGILHSTSLPDIIPTMYEPYYLNLANVLKPALRSSDIVAPEVLGIVSYTLMDNPMHDWLGLVDSHIAHHGTVYFPTFGKADPVYSVDVVAPTVFAFASGADTLEVFEKYTNGSFGRRYRCWEVIAQPITLAIRRDREEDLLRALRQSNLRLRAFRFRNI